MDSWQWAIGGGQWADGRKQVARKKGASASSCLVFWVCSSLCDAPRLRNHNAERDAIYRFTDAIHKPFAGKLQAACT